MKVKRRQKVKQKTRKELRKEKRQQKKLNRFNYHNVKKDKIKEGGDKAPKKKKFDKVNETDSEEELFDDEEIPSSGDEEEEPPKIADDSTKLQKFLQREKAEHDEYFKEIRKNRVDQLVQANEEEDKVIAKYEKLLKLNRRKKKKDDAYTIGKFDDGLDYLLELCTDDNIQKMYQAAKEADNVQDEEEVPVERKKKKRNHSDSEDDEVERENLIRKSNKLKKIEEKYFGDDEDYFNNLANDNDGEDDDDSCDGNDSELGSENDSNEEFSQDENELEEMEQDDEEMSENMSNNGDQASEGSQSATDNEEEDEEGDTKSANKSKDGTWEDIYGRKRDKDGNLVHESTGKYVPPHMRKSLKSIDAENDPKRKEKLQNLKRQIKGHVNRLTEANMHRISIDIENIYNSNPRNDTNTVLTEIIVESLISNQLARERLVLEHTLLIATLHANLGSEIGAFFLQELVEKFDKLYQDIDEMGVGNKEIDNVVLIICHLFTFKLFKHTLIYEMLDKLCLELTEKRIECVLLVLRSIGFVLRKEDPIMLKEFILKAQKLVNSKGGDKDTRVAYMMETLLAIKNNNVTKIPQYDASLVEHFRKLLKQFVRAGNYVTTLVITMDDLLNAEERGKWWLVGSAWAGNNSSEKKFEDESQQIMHDEQKEKIFALAKKQRMNTEAKRNVFYILMTAEDYIDAFEKIISSTNDERTIVAVILHCCLSEKNYNAYYSVLAQKFCTHNRKFLLAMQFSIWDKIKELQNLSPHQINNLSRFIIHLIENDNLPLSALKVVEFTQIEKVSLRFMRQIMLGLLLTSEEKFHRIFERISPSGKLNSFKDQLRLFLKVFLMRDNGKLKINEDQMKLLKSRLELAEKFLSTKVI